MPIRNPFGRRSGVSLTQDEHARASTNTARLVEPPGFERVDTVGSKASSLSIPKSRTRNDVGVYELSGMSSVSAFYTDVFSHRYPAIGFPGYPHPLLPRWSVANVGQS